jgi:organic radical activating enzyme
MITQNIDRIVTRKDFDNQPKLFVTSIFRTIQGEGPYTGYPSVFVRFAGCNFGNKDPEGACAWCDTAFQIDKATQYSIEELCAAVCSPVGANMKDVLVITGGEPTLQPLLGAFIKAVAHNFSAVQLESNGTQAYFYDQAVGIRQVIYPIPLSLVVSPKANEKAGRYGQLSRTVFGNADCLKFVVSADPTSAHHTVPEWALTHSNVYVSPMAIYKRPYDGEVSSIWDADLIDAEATAANYAYAAQYAMKLNVKLSLQTHLFTSIP